MPILSRNISCNGNRTYPFLHLLSLSPVPLSPIRPLRLPNVLFSNSSVALAAPARSPRLSKLYPRAFLPLLYGHVLHSPFCFHRRATSSRTFKRLSSSILSLHSSLVSRTFAFALHKVFRVYADYHLENLFAFAGAEMLFSRKSTNLPFSLPSAVSIFANHRISTDVISFAGQREIMLAASFNCFASKLWIEMLPLWAKYLITQINSCLFYLFIIILSFYYYMIAYIFTDTRINYSFSVALIFICFNNRFNIRLTDRIIIEQLHIY